MAETTTIDVVGMTCAHCVAAVTDELEGLPGVVEAVASLVPDGVTTVTVVSDRVLTREELATAVDEAGYALAGAGDGGR
jgi:copper chaperone